MSISDSNVDIMTAYSTPSDVKRTQILFPDRAARRVRRVRPFQDLLNCSVHRMKFGLTFRNFSLPCPFCQCKFYSRSGFPLLDGSPQAECLLCLHYQIFFFGMYHDQL